MKLRDSTLLFLVKREESRISDILLAMKKRGFGAGRWNGVGGKVEAGEALEEAVKREALEEIDIITEKLYKIAELSFYFPHNPSFDQMVHVYLSESWSGTPAETEEMRPAWFNASAIPYEDMWPDDVYWIPHVLEDKRVRARFTFGEGDVVVEQNVEIVEKL